MPCSAAIEKWIVSMRLTLSSPINAIIPDTRGFVQNVIGLGNLRTIIDRKTSLVYWCRPVHSAAHCGRALHTVASLQVVHALALLKVHVSGASSLINNPLPFLHACTPGYKLQFSTGYLYQSANARAHRGARTILKVGVR